MTSWESYLFVLIARLGFLLTSPLIFDTAGLSLVGGLLAGLTAITISPPIRCAMGSGRRPTSDLSPSFLLVILVTLLMFFISGGLLKFYVSFELSALLSLMIITGWGYPNERAAIRSRLLLYSLAASLPLLASLVWLRTQASLPGPDSGFSRALFNEGPWGATLGLVAFLAFSTKLPVLAVHLWLPRESGEVSWLYSTGLATILLAWARYGLWVFSPIYFSYFFTSFWFFLGLVGAFFVWVLCLQSRGFKIIIFCYLVLPRWLKLLFLYTGVKIGASELFSL